MILQHPSPTFNTADYWKEIFPVRQEIQADLKRYGAFILIELVERGNENGGRGYRYRVEFEKVTLLLRYVLDDRNKISLMRSEASERKPGADLGE